MDVIDVKIRDRRATARFRGETQAFQPNDFCLVEIDNDKELARVKSVSYCWENEIPPENDVFVLQSNKNIRAAITDLWPGDYYKMYYDSTSDTIFVIDLYDDPSRHISFDNSNVAISYGHPVITEDAPFEITGKEVDFRADKWKWGNKWTQMLDPGISDQCDACCFDRSALFGDFSSGNLVHRRSDRPDSFDNDAVDSGICFGDSQAAPAKHREYLRGGGEEKRNPDRGVEQHRDDQSPRMRKGGYPDLLRSGRRGFRHARGHAAFRPGDHLHLPKKF